MAKIPIRLRLDEKFDEDIEAVQNMLDQAYFDIAQNLNQKPEMIIQNDSAPTSKDYNANLGDFWLNRDTSGGTPELYIMTVKNPTSATWVQIF